MNDLFLCESCERHVAPTEVTCPFCRATLGKPPVVTMINPTGLSRAKLYALHTAALATTVVVAVACGGETTTGADAAASDAQGDGNHVAKDSSAGSDGDVVFNDAGADVNMPDTAPYDQWTPPPYGCVFPGACGDTIV